MRNYRRLQRAQKHLSRLKQKRIRVRKICLEDAAAAIINEGLDEKILREIVEYQEKVEHYKGLLTSARVSPSKMTDSRG